ncbi:MAG: arylsulfatase [Chthoniobacter sp.]|nr:arylsulfatase [Chthoniobacter sp.]
MSITVTLENDTIKLPPDVHLPDGTRVGVPPPPEERLAVALNENRLAWMLEYAVIVDDMPADLVSGAQPLFLRHSAAGQEDVGRVSPSMKAKILAFPPRHRLRLPDRRAAERTHSLKRLRPMLVALVLVLPALLRAAEAAKSAKPNIIFILSDDLAQGDVGCYGQKLIQTPNLDRMAREGTRYTQAYCGTAVCAPSRTSLMIGQHTGHSPIRANREIGAEGQLPLPAGTFTVARLLKSEGYATACIGKWGMGMFDTTGSPLKLGFDHFFGYNCQRHAHSYFPKFLYNDDQRFSLESKNGKIYAQNLIADETLKFVNTNKDRPFFLYYSITLPHGNFEIDDQGIYKDKPWSEQEKNYAAMVTRLDTDVGRILALLKELNLDDQTLIMLAGDNGSSFPPDSPLGKRFEQAANGLRGFKRSLYEGALRQAALARWPGTVPAGRVSEEAWAFWDFLPTCAELSGGNIPAEAKLDGLSLVSFLKGGPAPKREYFYWELHEAASLQAVRWGGWKALRNGPSKSIEIYDLTTNAAESKNLAAEKPDLVAKAESLMEAAHTDDPNWPMRDSKRPAENK